MAVVTGASTGIGFELAKCCAGKGFSLLIAADEAKIHAAASELRADGASVEAIEADLATTDGVDTLCTATRGRPVAALLANAGCGLGRAFLDQSFDDIRCVIDTNVTGTLYSGCISRCAARQRRVATVETQGCGTPTRRPSYRLVSAAGALTEF